MRRIAAGLAALALAMALFVATPEPGSAGIVVTGCSAVGGGQRFDFFHTLLDGDEAAAWQLFPLGIGPDYESGTFDVAKLKAGKVTFEDRTGIQLDGTPSGDQNVEAKLVGKLRGDADAFRVKLVLKDETGGETF